MNFTHIRSGAALLAACALALPATATAQATVPDGFTDRLVVTGLERPAGLAFIPDGRLLVVEQKTARVRLIVIPATQEVYLQAVREGLVEIFVEAGGAVSTPTCGPCLGGHMGVLAEGERAVATTNRNFVGRMGHPKSEVYLANPAVSAASAITGQITSPEELKL